MYGLNRTGRIFLAALVGAVVTSASISAASVFLQARSILDNRFTAVLRLVEYVAPRTQEPGARAGAWDDAAPGAIDTDGDGITDASSDIGLAAIAAMSGESAQDTPICGGAGQRACCLGERWALQTCEDGKAEIPGCSGSCTCSTGDPSFGTCVDVTPCGGEGQRACIEGDKGLFTPQCDHGLTPLPGCSGDCFAKGFGSVFSFSPFTCAKLKDGGGFDPIAEPNSNVDLSGATTSCSMSGYADMHLHLFADMAHGGGVLAGKPYDPEGGINEALKQDFTTHDQLVKGRNNDWVGSRPAGCPDWLFTFGECDHTFFHGEHDIVAGDTIGAGTKDGATSNMGAPIFNGWPKWTSTTHQQAYYRWLKRAWRGGLRLTTMLAVTNEALCKTARREYHTRYGTPAADEPTYVSCEDSMASIRQQIAATKAFETWIKNNDGAWFEIAYTPLEARKIIAQGHLAVVLGVETAELFNCKFPIDQCTLQDNFLNESDQGFIKTCPVTFDRETNSREGLTECTPEKITTEVQALFDLGVRHVFPIHNFDNAFGGAATWMDTIEVGNRIVEDHWWWTRDCYGEDYRLALGKTLFDGWYKSLLVQVGDGTLTGGVFHSEQASCNFFGLFPQGRVLIEELMKKGMIIDVDHMSVKAFNATLDMANQGNQLKDWRGTLVMPNRRTQHYPVVASHVQVRDMHFGEIVHERMRTTAQLLKIKQVGGMIAAMLKDDQQDTDNKGQNFMNLYGAVKNDCRHSSKSFANQFQYAVDTMGAPVAFGSDFNGVAGHLGPRFGSEACGGRPEAAWPDIFPVQVDERQKERSAQYREGRWLPYPFVLSDGIDHNFGSFSKQQTGAKVFDYNRDGLAHIGLLPDFVADLKNVGLPDDSYNKIFKSAEEYIKVWESSLDETFTGDTCTFFSDPAISFESAPPSTFEGDDTVFKFTAHQGWDVTPSCLPLEKVLSQSISQEAVGNQTEYTIHCAWKGGDWGGPQVGSVSVDATNFLGTPPPVKVTVDVLNKAPTWLYEGGRTLTLGQPYDTQLTLQDSPGELLGLRVNWGDDTVDILHVPPGLQPISHVYGEPNTYRVFIRMGDEQAEPLAIDFEVKVTGSPDKTPPESWTDLPGALVGEANRPDGRAVSYHPGGHDAVFGNLVATCDPPTETIFPIGTTTVTCRLEDPAGNSVSRSFTVTIRDTTPPHPTVQGDIAVDNAPEEGIAVQFTATALDIVDLSRPVQCTPASGTTFPIGRTTVTCESSDTRGNTSTTTFDVNVLPADKTPPAVIVPQFAAPSHHYRFDEIGPTALDTGMDPALRHGPIPTTVTRVSEAACVRPGAPNNALVFQNQPLSHVNIGDVAFDNDDFTVGLWFKTTMGGYGALLSNTVKSLSIGSNLLPTTNGFRISIADGKPAFTLTDPNFVIGVSSTIPANDGLWHHVLVRRANRVTTLVIDGQSAGVDEGPVQDLGATEWWVGADPGADQINKSISGLFPPVPSLQFVGAIADVQIFNRALTDAEIGTLAGAFDEEEGDDACAAIPPDILIDATVPAGAVVHYTATAVDTKDGARPVACTFVVGGGSAASGTTFPIGTSHVACWSTDGSTNPSIVAFTVEVRSGAMPLISVPVDITVEADGPSGTLVTYPAPTAHDPQDGERPVTCSPSSLSQFPLGPSTVTCSASDSEGHSVSDTFVVNVVDTIPPVVTPTVAPLANAAGWHKGPPTVTWAVTDSVGVTSSTGCDSVTQTMDTQGMVVTCVARDAAGNANSKSITLRVDQTAPQVTFGAVFPAANVNGWHNIDVAMAYAVIEQGSGLPAGVRFSGFLSFSQEGTGVTQTMTVTDVAGNSVSAVSPGVNLDKTDPTIEGSRSPLANANGWNNTDVTASFTCHDDRSGVEHCSNPMTVTSEGANQARAGLVFDRAGNAAFVFVSFSIDKTKPTISSHRDRPPNANDWYNADVIVTFACSDGLSGIESCSVPATVGSDGASQSRTGNAVDRAGNQATATESGINLDETSPTIIGSRSPLANANGWNNTSVMVSFACADTLSGVVACPPTATIATEGANQSRGGEVFDRAGNRAATSVGSINIDKTPPVVTCSNDMPTLWPPNHELVAVTAVVTVDDNLSGAPGFTLLRSASNEPDNGLGDGDTANDRQGWALATPDTVGMFRAERSGKGTGRIYTLGYQAVDLADNVGVCTTMVSVVNDTAGKK